VDTSWRLLSELWILSTTQWELCAVLTYMHCCIANTLMLVVYKVSSSGVNSSHTCPEVVEYRIVHNNWSGLLFHFYFNCCCFLPCVTYNISNFTVVTLALLSANGTTSVPLWRSWHQHCVFIHNYIVCADFRIISLQMYLPMISMSLLKPENDDKRTIVIFIKMNFLITCHIQI